MQQSEEDTQARILRAFTVLSSVRANWPGALVLNIGLDPVGSAISLAANVAGAVSLTIEPDSAVVRNALRSGSCDFVVNTLDEALRAIKNEIRKHRPLSVGLEGEPSSVLAEIIDRGVAPEIFTGPTAYPEAAAHFRSLGALLVSFAEEAHTTTGPVATIENAAGVLEAFLATRVWQMRGFNFSSYAEVRDFDARALALLPAESEAVSEDRLRRQWLLSAARILPRDRHRTLWLTDEENRALGIEPD
jgi:urocanate hydratase